ncbi:type 2 lantipeptide synthetase LanM [Nostoc flagelliforme FACHB-838]|uniref:Type 2 lantipeptide synthetase LanM n=1 Tax=Nostoc flagelliforme FACHB-838 TaxID=2692904 RepID=A0ABR8DVC7_9NOSO|nr:type 2 lanthipeptide synthetase LanM family protein [Nostoc flagelliforme]MBD2532835.1 type 2 lantipeptide synthetase LanM [Nostoc flagelliforme FACHB-838]
MSPHNYTLELTSLVAKASTLAERLNNSSLSQVTDKDETQISERLERWCQVVAQGKLAKFQRRLACLGLDIDTIRPLLVNAYSNEQQPLPSWATTLEQVIQTAQNLGDKHWYPYRYLNPEKPVPFEPIYVPCLQVATQLLLAQVGDRLKLLTDSAMAALERELVLQLSVLCSSTLMEEFSTFRSSGNAVRDFLLLCVKSPNSKEKYYAFIDKLFQDGLLSLFQEYSVLGRLVATAIDFWVEATTEFLNSLATDWSDIEQCFGGDTPLKQVMAVKPGLSDPHNRGRSVIALTFDTGMQLVYKPKDFGLDVAYYTFLEWCNSHTTLLPFKVIQVLNRSTYGWVEYVESQPCEDESAVRRFYQRSGMLLCLIHTLEGTDCHSGNLIANGEQPVLVDLETLLHHRNKSMGSSESDATMLVEKQLAESVLRTWILPQWGIFQNDQLTVDLSGLGGVEEQKVLTTRIQNINTDAMNVGYETVVLKEANVPTIRGISLSPDDYLEDLVAGFEQMYRLLFSHQAVLLAPTSPLMILAHQKVRYVFRSTRIYHRILQNSYAPSLLRFGIDRSIALDVLSRAFLTWEQKPVFWSILAAELQAVEQSDIPIFTVLSSSDSLELPKGVIIPELFEEPSFKRVLRRLSSLNEADLAQQIEIIRGSFYSRFVREPNLVSFQVVSTPAKEVMPLTKEQLVQQAITIAVYLRQRAICAADGSVSWISLKYRANTQGFQLQSLGVSLYDGSSGVALFLAALAKVTGNSEWHELALRTLQPLCKVLQDSNPENAARLTRQVGMSGTTGLGSIAYALAQISQLLQEPALLQDALKAAALITPDLIAADKSFDIMAGAAGTILSLLALPASTSLEMAIACGEHLLQHQTSTDNCPKAWKNSAGKQLTGFSQGAAGIAYALVRLYAVTQDSRFLDAANEAIAYEQSVFSTEAQNWPDLGFEEPCLRVSWANGAAGIGLGRLGGLSVLDTVEIRQEIAIALETTIKFAISNVDNLCWGNLGRIETLLVAAQKLNRPDLLEDVHQAVTHILTQVQAQGTFTLFPDLPPKVYNPGFFHGATGIGYQLLRIAYPSLLPSVLRLSMQKTAQQH